MNPYSLDGKHVVITGGTGSIGQLLVDRLLSGEAGNVARVTVFSRDEAKQDDMRRRFNHQMPAGRNHSGVSLSRLQFQIGDVRDPNSVRSGLRSCHVVFHCASLKQIPTCEYFPEEAVQTNVLGTVNILQAIENFQLPVELVVGISTDKACQPVSVMGMTKAILEKLLVCANLRNRGTRYVCVRYGNVLSSRGSVVPLFIEQILQGGPVSLTDPAMTRFFLTPDSAVNLILDATREARPGETYVPLTPSGRILDLAQALVGDRDIEIRIIGARPGDRIHEVLISHEESLRSLFRGENIVIRPIFPELSGEPDGEPSLNGELTSAERLMSQEQMHQMLKGAGLFA